jgi:hypothetical protein
MVRSYVHYNKNMSKKYQWYLGSLCLLGLVMIVVATWKYGAGVSSDAVRNLSTVDSMLAGRGFVDLNGNLFTWWPPLYPALLYVVSVLTKIDPFVVAWYLNVMLFVVNIWLVGWFFWVVFPEKPIYAVACALVYTLSRSVLSVHANVSSDPLFISFMFIYFYLAAQYLQKPSSKWIWWMFILSGLSFLHRYPGIVFFAVTGLMVLYREGFRPALKAIPQAFVGILPSVAWILLFTYARTHTFFGPRDPGSMLPLENANQSLARMVHWFIPLYQPFAYVLLNPWILLLPLILIFLVFNRKQHWFDFSKAMGNSYVAPYLLFSILYYVVLLFTVVTSDHKDVYSDRYYVILFPLVLVIGCFAFQYLILGHFGKSRAFVRYASAALFVLWLIYPLMSLQEYLRLSLENGEASEYNIQNTRTYRESKVIKMGRQLLSQDPKAAMYSNYANVIWFAYRRPVDVMPARDIELSFDQRIDYLEKKYPGWPNGKDGYILWFKPNQYHHIADPRELDVMTHLELLYEDKKAALYRVTTLP